MNYIAVHGMQKHKNILVDFFLELFEYSFFKGIIYYFTEI